MVSDKLKQIVFKELYRQLKDVEIIPYNGSMYFIDRENKYWYFEFDNNGNLWWRYDFFSKFFIMFSLERHDYERILADWVEEVLNSKVSTTSFINHKTYFVVEEVLNSKVSTTHLKSNSNSKRVEEVLNSKVLATPNNKEFPEEAVEEVLNSKVLATQEVEEIRTDFVEEVLSHPLK